ncbi:large ribosomal subunit protein bL12m [Anabrus simplex]|uniref:large ribosomal subunit protein bL12m n=1 Tax=Anabrus simplex TaxID=316456 RepID=UPI0035A3CA2F
MMLNMRLRIYQSLRQCRRVSQSLVSRSSSQAAAMQVPPADGDSKVFAPKIEGLVSSIAQLNLLEIAELNQALKKRLNLPDAPVMAVGAIDRSAAAKDEDEEDAAPQRVQTSFTVKLLKFDDKQKVALIKEVKNLMEGMNLVQAKKFVESAPTVVKADIGKDEAETLRDALTKTCQQAMPI